jgi:hypothetical protein
MKNDRRLLYSTHGCFRKAFSHRCAWKPPGSSGLGTLQNPIFIPITERLCTTTRSLASSFARVKVVISLTLALRKAFCREVLTRDTRCPGRAPT